MVSLPTMSVLIDYWSSENGQYIYGKVRVRGVQIRCGPSNLLRCGQFVVQNVPLKRVICEISPQIKG